MRQQLPNFITLLNAASGFAAIVYASASEFTIAVLLLLLAAIFDFFDGAVARMLSVTSKKGVWLDSMADLVSFGVAPGVFLIFFFSTKSSPNPGLLALGALLFIGALVRLVRFSLSEKESSGNFEGLPTPAMTLSIVGFSYYFKSLEWSFDTPVQKLVVTAMVLVHFIWMISKVKTLGFKFKNARFRENWNRYLFVALLVVLFPLLGVGAVPLVFVGYGLLSVTLKF